jgi:hypothetical protein
MINRQPFKRNYLLLAICVIGVCLIAWWAWAAGPVETKPSAAAAPSVQTRQGISGQTYSPATSAGSLPNTSSSSSSAGQAVGSPVQSAQPISVQPSQPVTEPDPLYPYDPIPKCTYYHQPGTVQPYICPQCEAVQSPDGTSYMPCGSCRSYPGGPEIMCPL